MNFHRTNAFSSLTGTNSRRRETVVLLLGDDFIERIGQYWEDSSFQWVNFHEIKELNQDVFKRSGEESKDSWEQRVARVDLFNGSGLVKFGPDFE